MTLRLFRAAGFPVILLGLCLLPAECNPPAGPDARVVSENGEEVLLEVATPAWALESVAGPDGPYQRVCLPGWARTAEPGRPELPVKGVLVQVPPTGPVELEVVQEEVVSRERCRPWPVPEQALVDGRGVETRFVKDEEAYRSGGPYPAAAAEAGERAWVRGVPVVRVRVHPFRWDASTGELTVAGRVRVRVRFPDPAPAANPAADAARAANSPAGAGPFHGLLRASVINYRGAPVPGRGGPSDAAARAAAVPTGGEAGLKVRVVASGIHRLRHEDLLAAGVEIHDPAGVRMFLRGEEIAVRTSSASAFGPGDFVEFYGQAAQSPYSGANVYWLRQEAGAWGKRMAAVDGSVTGTGVPLDGFLETLHEEENLTYWGVTPGAPAADYWFFKKSTAPDLTEYALDIPGPVPGLAEAVVRVAMQGRTTAAPHPNHHTVVRMNGAEVGDAAWDGDTVFVQEMTVPGALVLEGANSLVVDCPGDSGAPADVVYQNWVEVEYLRRFAARDDRLTFSVEGGGGRFLVRVTDLSGPDVLLYDITDPLDVREVAGVEVEDAGGTYTASFEDEPAGPRTYTLLTEAGTLAPESLEFRAPEDLTDASSGADYLLIAPGPFLGAVAPLVALRQAQGLRARAVSVEDIYDVFNHGMPDPEAIRAFLGYAYENWASPAPAYVLLAGDATLDHLGYLGTGKQSRVPAPLHPTPLLGLTPEDNYYVCVEGDDPLPEMFVGRIPGADAEALAGTVGKIVAYESAPVPAPADFLFAADDDEAGFEQLSEELEAHVPPEFEVHRLYLADYGAGEDPTPDLIGQLDGGRMLTTYVGHGNVAFWASERLLDAGDVPLLAPGGPLTFAVALTCLNGYFIDTARYCLAEAFVAPPDRGAIGCFAPGGLGYLWEHDLLGNALFEIFFERAALAQGPWTTEARLSAYAQGATEDTLRTYALFGDPATYLNTPVEPPDWAAAGP